MERNEPASRVSSTIMTTNGVDHPEIVLHDDLIATMPRPNNALTRYIGLGTVAQLRERETLMPAEECIVGSDFP